MRFALTIEYDGSGFSGWQWQSDRRTIQACVEQAVSRVADERVSLVCAGRTDAGVHACEQIVHFDTSAERDARAWTMGVNTHLPDDVRIVRAQRVDGSFHARYSALARFYRYVILNRAMKSALLRRQVTWCYYPLDIERMQAAANHLLGEHDFTSFRARDCQSKSPRRRMHRITVRRIDQQVHIDVVGNAFLHHMVRNIAGVLMAIGSGRQEPDWALEVLTARDRAKGGVTAAAHGLYLVAVYYPEHFGLPQHTVFKALPGDVTRFDEGHRR